jgi:serine/threonine protein phosphatase PrpC
MQCVHCQQENRDKAIFCAWCGEPLLEPGENEPAAERRLAEEPPWLLPANAATILDSAAASEAKATMPTGRLTAGQVLAERYEILEPLEEAEGANTYRARDLFRCARCGTDDNQGDREYCCACGASLAEPSTVIIVEEVHHPPEGYRVRFQKGDRDYYVVPEATARENESSASTRLSLSYGLITDPGQQRDHNEDYVEARVYTHSHGDLLGLFIVADGLGGQDSGEVASRMATETVWKSLCQRIWLPFLRGDLPPPDEPEEALIEAVLAANAALYLARTEQGSQMSTTLTMALVVNQIAYVANVGDSRTYRWASGGLERITRDHSLVQRLVDTGQITAQEAYSHPKRNIIYHSIGDRPEIEVDTFRCPLNEGDRLILCSDGLWEMVREEGLEEILMAEAAPRRACERLVEYANMAGGDDNISVIVVQVAKQDR